MSSALPRAATQTIPVEAPVIVHTTDPVHTAMLDNTATLNNTATLDHTEPMILEGGARAELGDLDPAALAASWLPAEGEERMLMTLSTIDDDGYPRSRTVMLSEYDGERFFFHTDALSRKVADVTANPRVSLTVLWPGFTRQLVIQGIAERAPEPELIAAYRARSPYLQQLAWLNTTNFAVLPLAERVKRWTSWSAQNPEPVQPASWVGFGVTPHRMMFWVSHPEAASRRIEFVREDSGWQRRILPG